jgi:transposase
LRQNNVQVVEVNRPNRQVRRRHGKSDPADAEAAARATLAGDAMGAPKSQDGSVEIIRFFRLQRRSAFRARTQTANQLHAVVSTAPESLRSALRDLTLAALLVHASKMRASKSVDLASAPRIVLRGLALRWHQLHREVELLDEQLESRVSPIAPALVALRGVGVEVAGALLVAARDNPERLEREASFAALCGVSPVDASSGKQHRHRLNRGGNRALWVIALVRVQCDERTRNYVSRRTQDGLSKPEIIRCLKRYIAREIFKIDLQLALRHRRRTRAVHLHRALLQPDQAAFTQRLQDPERNRSRLAQCCADGINQVSTESGQSHFVSVLDVDGYVRKENRRAVG